MRRASFCGLLSLCLALFAPVFARAGGSGLNTVIVVNQSSTNSIQLGNYFRELRNLPPQNVIRINWNNPTNTVWAASDFTNVLLNPLLTNLVARQLTNQIDYVVLSMDIPYRVNDGQVGSDSTTSALFYGYKSVTSAECELASSSTNLYSGTEAIFRTVQPSAGYTNSFLVTMITGTTVSNAEIAISQGVAGDYTFPTNQIWLGKSSQPDYNVRYPEFDNTIFDTRVRGVSSVAETNIDSPGFSTLILGYENGAYAFYPSVPLCVPGAMADNLNSYGGMLFENTAGETTVLSFITNGATCGYGTVTEPCDYLQKFPDSQIYFYQSRGFSTAECYYMGVTNPYQGMVLGEPLSSPFAKPGSGSINTLTTNSILTGSPAITGQFLASDFLHPLQQVDLFVDGLYYQTITNIAPVAGTAVGVNINSHFATYTIPSGATLKSVASNLCVALNATAYRNSTGVIPTLHGDRIELQVTNRSLGSGTGISISTSNYLNSATARTAFAQTPFGTPTNFLDTIAHGVKNYYLSGTLSANSTLTLSITRTNSTTASITVTNNGNTTLPTFIQQFMAAVNSSPSFSDIASLNAPDYQGDGAATTVTFDLKANAPGINAAQISAIVTGSVGLVVTPIGSQTLTDNATDLYPRSHIYVSVGTTNLPFTNTLPTTAFADGYHELAYVAYEGTAVHTQTRFTLPVIFRNTGLSATLSASLSGSTNSLQPTLSIQIAATDTNAITSIQLFSTAGSVATVTGQSNTTFAINLTNLDIGLHPFYALVTDAAGKTYRTRTQSIRIIGVNYATNNLFGVDLPFSVQLKSSPLTFTWPATAGRTYTILATTNLSSPFTAYATVTPTNSLGQWSPPDLSQSQLFYRVSAAP